MMVFQGPIMDARTVQRGDAIPHFEVRTAAGQVFRYADIWQRRHLVLVMLPVRSEDERYISELSSREAEFRDRDTALVITRESVDRLPQPSALVADRWGEIAHVANGADVSELPTASELLDWVDYVAQRCPECEGEAK